LYLLRLIANRNNLDKRSGVKMIYTAENL